MDIHYGYLRGIAKEIGKSEELVSDENMEMNMGKFSEKLVELLELAKKKKNVLEYQEINDFFKDQPLDAVSYTHLYAYHLSKF